MKATGSRDVPVVIRDIAVYGEEGAIRLSEWLSHNLHIGKPVINPASGRLDLRHPYTGEFIPILNNGNSSVNWTVSKVLLAEAVTVIEQWQDFKSWDEVDGGIFVHFTVGERCFIPFYELLPASVRRYYATLPSKINQTHEGILGSLMLQVYEADQLFQARNAELLAYMEEHYSGFDPDSEDHYQDICDRAVNYPVVNISEVHDMYASVFEYVP